MPDLEEDVSVARMRVSVIIPSYNNAHYLPTSIESVLRQTRPVDELVVIDDGSTDNTRTVVESYGPPVRYVYQANRGLSGARNAGIQASSGDLIAFLDADDYWMPEKIELQVQAFENQPGLGMCYANVEYWHEREDRREVGLASDPAMLWPQLRYHNAVVGGGSVVMLSRAALDCVGGFREDLRTHEDWDMWLRVAWRFPVAHRPEVLAVVRLHSDSMSQHVGNMRRNMELFVEQAPLLGLSGWQRWAMRHRVRAVEFSKLALMARVHGQCEEHGLIWRSILEWPVPWFHFQRFKLLAVYLRRRLRAGKRC